MIPEAVGVLTGCVSIISEVLEKALMGKEPRLGDPIHAFSDFNENISILVGELTEIVLIDDDFGDFMEMNAHLLRDLHGHIEVKILDVCSHERHTWRGCGDVRECFYYEEAGGWRADMGGIVNYVANSSEAHRPFVAGS